MKSQSTARRNTRLNIWCRFIPFLLLVYCFGNHLQSETFAKGNEHSKINCEIQKGPCSHKMAGRTVTLEVLPRPVQAMQDLRFIVTVDDEVTPQQPPYIDLNMPAMDMGRNRVPLKSNGKGVYEGKGVIVRCRSGHRTWRATVNFPGIGIAEFIFDVIY